MKSLILLLIFLFSISAKAALYVSLSLKDKTEVRGEFIELYKDRWFYETETKHTKKYILLFRVVANEAEFIFKDIKEIRSARVSFHGRSSYKKYLLKNDLVFKNKLVDGASVLTGNEGHHKFEKMYGNFAWDIGVLDNTKKQFKNQGLNLRDYYIFDKKVQSPISGVVVGKVDDQLDNDPSPKFIGDLNGKINNYLTIKVAGPLHLSIVHFKQNSISVNIGDRISVGQVLGKVGNSGVSYVPHLHYTMYAYIPSYDRFISIPGFFE